MARKGWADVSLSGMDELRRNLEGLRGYVDSKDVTQGLHSGLKIVQRIAKNKAPKGPTGNLKKAIVSGIFRRQIRGSPAAYMAIDYSIGPHAHLVEFGTKRRVPRKWGFLQFEIDGKTIFAKYAKGMPAKPFWRPAVDIGKSAAGRIATKKIAKSVEQAASGNRLRRMALRGFGEKLDF